MIFLPNGSIYEGPAVPERKRINRFEERGYRLAAGWPDDARWAEWMRQNGYESEDHAAPAGTTTVVSIDRGAGPPALPCCETVTLTDASEAIE